MGRLSLFWSSQNKELSFLREWYKNSNRFFALSIKSGMNADLFEAITQNDAMPETVRESYPDLDERDYWASFHMISLLLSALEYYDWLSPVEDDGKLDEAEAARLVDGMISKLQAYRQDPYGFLGRENPNRKSELNELLTDIDKTELGIVLKP